MSEAIAIQNGHAAGLEFTSEQRQMIRDNFANGASDAEFSVFLEVARVRKLNPLTRQIHLVKRWNSDLNRHVWTPQTGIDGLRSIAERTGKYDGQDEPEYEYDALGKIPKLAKVRVYRKDWTRPAVGVAHFSEYAQFKKDGSPTHMWKEKPHVMLAKCAEALAIRKAFPEDTGGLYTDEEMKSGPAEESDAPASPPAKPARAGLQVVEVDTKALAARRIDADATLTEKLQETVATNSQQGPRADGKQVAGDDGSRHTAEGPRVSAAPVREEQGRSVAPDGHGSAEGGPPTPAAVATLPFGPSKFEQLLALLDEVRQSGGWKSKARMREWCTDYKAHIDPLSESEKATIRGAIEVCGYRK